MCKIWMVIYDAIFGLEICSCDAALALCLGALLQVKGWYLSGIMMISIGPRIVASIFNLIGNIQYPGAVQCHIQACISHLPMLHSAEPVSDLDKELGYPCYLPSPEQWVKLTIAYIGHDIRFYITFATTAVLLLLAGAALVVRYKGHKGHLVQVLRRDGGLYYIVLAGIRLAGAMTRTPAIMSLSQLDSNPGVIVLDASSFVVVPILAQRLMINLRKADYMGSQPIASTLLFAPPPPGSEDNEDQGPENQDLLEVNVENSHGCADTGAGDSPGSASGIQSA
ncbi:hypothetical protein NMY22_g1886 [Coprinellus aureogranulatus]|nr:hypothetical protein NMY22_g1886 [Coprinellus aureogranulatus]